MMHDACLAASRWCLVPTLHATCGLSHTHTRGGENARTTPLTQCRHIDTSMAFMNVDCVCVGGGWVEMRSRGMGVGESPTLCHCHRRGGRARSSQWPLSRRRRHPSPRALRVGARKNKPTPFIIIKSDFSTQYVCKNLRGGLCRMDYLEILHKPPLFLFLGINLRGGLCRM